jgi:hypothetical protein
MSVAIALGTSNTAWPDLGRNPKGRGHFPRICVTFRLCTMVHSGYTQEYGMPGRKDAQERPMCLVPGINGRRGAVLSLVLTGLNTI